MSFIDFKPSLAAHLGFLFLLCAVLYFSHLGVSPFFNKGEPREAIVVQDITQHGNWLFPRRMGSGVPSKPPLFHWFAAFSSMVRGRVTEVTTRFPSALFATLGVLLLCGMGRKIFDPVTGLLGGLILATSMDYSRLAVVARVDMTMTFFLSLGLALFYLLHSHQLRGTFWTYTFYFVLGVGVLAKGPVSLVLTGMTIVVFLGVNKRWSELYGLCLHRGALLTVGIAMSWYCVALVQGGEDFFGRQIIHENLARFFSYGEIGTGHKKPIYYYLPYLFSGGLPWTLLLPFVVFDFFKERKYSDEGTLFLGVWAAVVFVLFSLSGGKRAPYILPLFPPLALITSSWILRTVSVDGWKKYGFRILAAISFLVALSFVVSIPKAVWDGDPMWFLSPLASLLKPKDQANLWVVKEGMARGGWLFIAFLLLASVLWLSLSRFLWNLQVRSLPWTLAGISILSVLLAQNVVLPTLAGARSYGPFMQEVNRVTEGSRIYLYPDSIDSYSVVFYRGGSMPLVGGPPQRVASLMRSSGDYFLMGERDWVRILKTLGGFHPPVLRSKATGPDGKARLVLVRGVKSELL